MGGCISRLSLRHENSREDGDTNEAEFAAHLQSVRSSPPRSRIEGEQSSEPRARSEENAPIAPLTPRLNEKVQLLEHTLERAGQAGIAPDLVEYGQQVAHYLSANLQPNDDMLSLDLANFHRLADSYNRRYPDLELRHIDSPGTFLEALDDRSTNGAWRAVVRLADGAMHHFAADVRTRAGTAPTVIVMEPANLYTFVTAYLKLRRDTLQQLGNEPKWAFIGVGAQKSAADCVMFGLNFALGAYQKWSAFDGWHENLHQHGTIAYAEGASSSYMPSPDAMLEYADINLFHGEKFLPALFYKHSHSREVIDEVASYQSGIKDDDLSTSRRNPKTESLVERLDGFAVQREERHYSASIETSRATKIRTALDRMLPTTETSLPADLGRGSEG